MRGWSGLEPRSLRTLQPKALRTPDQRPKAGRGGPGCWDGSHWPRRTSEGKDWCQGTQQGRERRLLSVLRPAA